MKYISACYGQQGRTGEPENRSSLVLVQYVSENTPLCFICVCQSERAGGTKAGSYLTGRLLQWQQDLPWKKMAERPGQWFTKIEKRLDREIRQIDRELAESGLVPEGDMVALEGALCAGQDVLVFSRGMEGIYLLNTGFGKSRIRQISLECRESGEERFCEGTSYEGESACQRGQQQQELQLRQGILEQDAGLLFVTKSFGRLVRQADEGSSLFVREIQDGRQAGRRLGELGKYGEELGETDMGAVLLYCKKEGKEKAPDLSRKQSGEKRADSSRERLGGKRADSSREQLGEKRADQSHEQLADRNAGVSSGSAAVRGPDRKTEQVRDQSGESSYGWEQDSEEIQEKKEREFLRRHGYEARRLLGQGAFSRVYLARMTDTGEQAACKVSCRKELVEREGALLERVQHPLFAAYRERWQEGKMACLVMEYVPGGSLEALLRRRGSLPARTAVRVAVELAEGLRYLHTMQDPVLFRDVKPANIMIRQDGKVKLLDLGCACLLEEETFSRAGTPGFGAPEQMGEGEEAGELGRAECEGSVRRLSPASDVYGLGQTLGAMLGRPKGVCRNGKIQYWSRRKACWNRQKSSHGFRNGSVPDAAIRFLQERRCRRRMQEVAEICTRQELERRFPDMQSVTSALLACLPGKESGRRMELWGRNRRKIDFYRDDLVCEKNIWKTVCKNY